MPPGRRRRKDRRPAAVPPADGVDRIGDLPDALLHYVLSCLPAEEAVRTCVLARRWRHLWKSATGLRIGCGDENQPPTVTQVQEFVDHLLLLRGDSPLDTCEIRLFESDERDMPRVNLWIRQVILCKVRVLRIRVDWDVEESFPWHDLEALRPVSRHLTSLELTSLRFFDDFLDFSSCPALEDLEIDGCDFMYADRISSLPLKRLSITSSCTFDVENRTHICAPNLVSLRLEVGSHRTPVLESMPSLVKAVMEIGYLELDSCSNADSGDCDDEYCDNCYGADDEDSNCVLLQGLSEAKYLVLISHVKMFIFRRDLKWCPIFRNLKTLLLNEYWCVPADFSALTCVLEHSPVLEKLTLQLFCKGPKAKVEMNGSPDPTKRSASISEHLKIVALKCEVVDERVLNVLKFLSKLNIDSFRFQF